MTKSPPSTSRETPEEKIRRLEKRVRELEVQAKRIQELSSSHEFLNSLVENIPNMVFVKDAVDLRFVMFNKAGQRLLGYSQEDLIGKNDYDFFPAEQADFFTSKDRAVLTGHEIVDIPEEQIQTRNQGVRTLHTKKIPVFGDDDRPRYLLGISEDITEYKQAEEQRRRLIEERAARVEADRGIRLRDEFLSIASHELKTPVTSLKLQLQLARKRLEPGTGQPELTRDRLQRIFDIALRQVNRLAALVEDLLDVSRIEAGKLSYDFRSANLSDLVREVVASLSDQFHSARCPIALELEEKALVRADRFRMEQVIVNLLSNAMKYGAGKPIRVIVRSMGPMVRLEVKDMGMGISADMREKIFLRFERAVSAANISGLGLGLYITKQIVAAHQGTIRVESEPGQGSDFVVDLPVARDSS